MKTYRKTDYPPVRKFVRYLDPGPIVLVGPARKERQTFLTMGWHLMLQLSPALFGGYISKLWLPSQCDAEEPGLRHQHTRKRSETG